jgi:monoterpene epsilon-lactone hydrolase
MASTEYEQFLAAIGTDIFTGNETFEEAHEKLEALHGHPIAESTAVAWHEIEGCRWATVRAEGVPDDGRVLLLFHGGAFIAAGGDGYLFYAEMLSARCGTTVVLADYRLAPQHRFPMALNDCIAVYRAVLDAGMNAKRIVLIGDSCGGGLVISTLVAVRNEGLPLPAAAITLGGWFDLAADSESATAPVGRDPFANASFTRARGLDYVGTNGDPRDPRASPLFAELSGLPPLLLQVGQIDFTRDEAISLGAKAARCGVHVTVEVWPEMVHGFQGLASASIPESLAAIDAAKAFYDRHVAAT